MAMNNGDVQDFREEMNYWKQKYHALEKKVDQNITASETITDNSKESNPNNWHVLKEEIKTAKRKFDPNV